MKTNSILIKEGKAFAVCEEIPKEPDHKRYGVNMEIAKLDYQTHNIRSGYDAWLEYESAIQLVKDNATEFKDQFTIFILLHASLKIEHTGKSVYEEMKEYFKEGELYPLSVEVEIIEVPEYPIDHTSYPPMKRIARIVEEPEEKERIVFSENKIGQAATVIMFLGEYIHGLDYGKNEKSTAIDLQNAKDAWKRFTGDSEAEDQEELFKELYMTCVDDDGGPGIDLNKAIRNFSITRIKQ